MSDYPSEQNCVLLYQTNTGRGAQRRAVYGTTYQKDELMMALRGNDIEGTFQQRKVNQHRPQYVIFLEYLSDIGFK